MSTEAIAIAGVGVALLAVLVPVVVLQSRRLEQRIDAVADVLASTRTELRTETQVPLGPGGRPRRRSAQCRNAALTAKASLGWRLENR